MIRQNGRSDDIGTAAKFLFWTCLGLASGWLILNAGINHDEIEHLATAYRIYTGDIPYQDFVQNHTPFYWYLLVPLVHTFKMTFLPLFMGRAISLLCILGMAVLYWGKIKLIVGKSSRILFLFATMDLIAGIETEAYRIRPDTLMMAFASIGFWLTVWSHKPRAFVALFVGVFMGGAMVLTPKCYPLLMFFPIYLFVFDRGVLLSKKFYQLTLYALGGSLATLPLIAYLVKYDLIDSFFTNVVWVNVTYSKAFREGVLDQSVFTLQNLAILVLILVIGYEVISPRTRYKEFLAGAVWVALSILIGNSVNHNSLYTYMALLLPLCFCGTFVFASLLNGLEKKYFQRWILIEWTLIVLLYSFPGFCFDRFAGTHAGIDLIRQMLVLNDEPNQPCLGFSPFHSIYCKNVGPITNRWDLTFANSLAHRSRGKDTYSKSVRATVKNITGDNLPDYFVWKTHNDIEPLWDQLLRNQVISQADYDMVKSMRKAYKKMSIGRTEVYVRKNYVKS